MTIFHRPKMAKQKESIVLSIDNGLNISSMSSNNVNDSCLTLAILYIFNDTIYSNIQYYVFEYSVLVPVYNILTYSNGRLKPY